MILDLLFDSPALGLGFYYYNRRGKYCIQVVKGPGEFENR